MIRGIYFDADEALLHSMPQTRDTPFDPTEGHDFELSFQNGAERYFVSVRPSAKRVIEFARELIGKENVFILTAGTCDYVARVNELADFGFAPENLIGREEWRHWTIAQKQIQPYEREDKNNVLIDNEHFSERNACVKRLFLGIDAENYLKIDDYWGDPSDVAAEEKFEEDVKNFLTTKQNLLS